MADKYYRLMTFIMNICPKPLRALFIFKAEHDPNHRFTGIENYLYFRRGDIENLRKRFRISEDQFALIYPAIHSVDIKTWDVTLLIVLLNGLFPKQLQQNERDCLRHITEIRTSLQHLANTECVTDEKFNTSWTCLRDAVLFLKQSTRASLLEDIEDEIKSALVDNMPSLGDVRSTWQKSLYSELQLQYSNLANEVKLMKEGTIETKNILTKANVTTKRHSDDDIKADDTVHGNRLEVPEKRMKIVDRKIERMKETLKRSLLEENDCKENFKHSISEILQQLTDNHRVIVTGFDNKLTYKCALAAVQERKYNRIDQCLEINNPSDWKRICSEDAQFVLFRDPFGISTYDPQKVEVMFEELDSMIQATNDDNDDDVIDIVIVTNQRLLNEVTRHNKHDMLSPSSTVYIYSTSGISTDEKITADDTVHGNLLDHLKPVLKIGHSVGSELGRIGCVGPFVRLQEKGEICFLTARHIFPGFEMNGLKVVYYPDPEDQKQYLCGEIIPTGIELDTTLVKISDEYIPKHCTFVDVNNDDLSRAGLKFPYKMRGTSDLRKQNPETYIKRKIVVHCPNGRLLTGNLNSEKSITLDTDSPESPVGASGSAVFLVEDNNSLSCIGILVGMSPPKNITFVLIQDILDGLSLGLGQSIVIEHFEDKKETDVLLDPKDAYIFNEALKKGSGKDRFVRINVVGNFEQGKTSLTRRLLNQSLKDIDSTDGIDVHVRKCKINDSVWVSSSTELDEDDWLLALAEESIYIKATKNETNEIYNDDTDIEASQINRNDTFSDSKLEKPVMDQCPNENQVTDDTDKIVESETTIAISGSIASRKNSSNEAKIEASFIEKYSSQIKDKMDMPSAETLTANIWDFGGQFIYYATHQIFHSRDAIYLLVFSLTKDLNEAIIDKDFPDRKSTMGDCLKFWLDSVHACAGSDEEVGTSEHVSKPFVILVGTFKDIFKGNSEKKFDEVLNLFVSDSSRRHLLSEQYAVSNTNMLDEEIQKLKRRIFELGRNHAEENRVPLKWIPLQIALLAEKSKNIITLEEVKNLNAKNENLVEEEELKTFLKYLHLKGFIIFFDEEDIEGHIVVNPQYLVDAFRCVIGSKSFIKDAKLHPLWKHLNETAILENELLDAMWKKEVEQDFLKNKDVLLIFLQRHRILSKLYIINEAGNITYQAKYMIPSLLKHRCEQRELRKFTDGKNATLVSLGLQIENTALLTSLFGRITAGALGKWSPVEIKKRVFVFKNIGHFRLDLEHVGKVELKTGKGIQLTVINQCPEIKVGSKVCDYFRRYIESLIKHDFQQRRSHMYNSNPYKYYLACNDRSHDGNGSENTYDIDDVRNKLRACCPDYQSHTIECKSAIDEWFPSDKVTELYHIENRHISNEELSAIAGCLGNNWRLLGVALGIKDTELDCLEMDYRNQTATCIYKMLCMWEQKHQGDATLLQLITCIENNPSVNVNKDMIKNIIEGN